MDYESDISSSSSSSDEFMEAEEQMFAQVVAVATNLLSQTPERVRGPNLNRDRYGAHVRLMNDYMSDDAVYPPEHFRRRFRMNKQLFNRILTDIESHYTYFQWKWDNRGRRGFSPQQKCTAAIRQLAYGMASDTMDEYLQMSEKTARDSMNYFCEGIIQLYGQKYLRKPTLDDIQKLYAAHESAHGFVGMLGSIDCTHWSWETCPVAWRGQFLRGDHEHPTVMLQAVASQDLWIWHAFFGIAGSNNDINVLNSSPLVYDISEGRSHVCPFVVNGVHYNQGYYLADGIYPEWAIFVKSFTCPQDEKRKRFKTVQEAARKDVERAFGVLKKRWAIIKNPARSWKPETLKNIMYACIILHNMILEDEGHAICSLGPNEFVPQYLQPQLTYEQRLANIHQIRSREIHNNLRSDLVEHINRDV